MPLYAVKLRGRAEGHYLDHHGGEIIGSKHARKFTTPADGWLWLGARIGWRPGGPDITEHPGYDVVQVPDPHATVAVFGYNMTLPIPARKGA